MKKNVFFLLSIIALSVLFVFIGRTLSNPEQNITSIVMQRGNLTNPGDFKVEKKAEWVDMGKAQITFEVNSIREEDTRKKDLIIVMDTSGSMRGKKLDRTKADAIDVINKVLENPDSRVALIEFSTTASPALNFTNNRQELFDKINDMFDGGSTSYFAPLRRVTQLMNGYQKKDDTDLILVFLTDGYPNYDNPNQISEFEVLKENYPYMSIHGIQYEMGNVINDALRHISDYQWVADIDTLNKVLHSASQKVINYKKFVITDYINNDLFEMVSKDDIVVPNGEVTISTENGYQKITWDLGDRYPEGQDIKMVIDLKLKDQYVDSINYTETNKKESVEYQLPNGVTETITSEETPRLQRDFRLIYDPNVPEGCVNPGTQIENHFSFEHITKKETKPTCSGYSFGGWEIINDDKADIKIINDDVFLMPNHNVTLRGVWKKATVNKNMSGEVKSSVNTLYEIMRAQAVRDDKPSQYVAGLNGIDFTQKASDTNGKGVYMLRNNQVVSDEQDYPILYYRGKVDNTNVLFAGYCWQIVRSTPDKGIRLLFNGEPTGLNNDQCDATGDSLYVEDSWKPEDVYSSWDVAFLGYYGTHRSGGYMSNEDIFESIPLTYTVYLANNSYIVESMYFNNTKYYSDSYTYNPETNTYNLVNPRSCYRSACNTLVGKYFIEYENKTDVSSLEYMARTYSKYGSIYGAGVKVSDGIPVERLLHVPFGTDVQNNGDGTYTLTGISYANLGEWNDIHSNFRNKYYCPDYTETCASPSFVSTTGDSYINEFKDSITTVYAATSSNGESLVNPVPVRIADWLTSNDYKTYNYICSDYTSNCSKDKILYAINRYNSHYETNKNKIFGSSVTWDGEYYHLVDPLNQSVSTTINSYPSYNPVPSLENHHYICMGYNEDKCKKVYYVIDNDPLPEEPCNTSLNRACTSYALAVELENGETDVVAKFHKRKLVEVDENKNVINKSKESKYKYILDRFYEAKLLPYNRYIDDAVWCNSRTATQENYQNSFLGGNSFADLRYDGGLRAFTDFRSPNIYKPVLKCEDKLDAFTVNDTKNGNGYLKYPIALITTDEFMLGGHTRNDSYLGNNDSYYFTLTPAYGSRSTEGYLFVDSGDIWAYANVSRYVKPSIVLKPNIEVLSGDGTKLSPYILDTNETD